MSSECRANGLNLQLSVPDTLERIDSQELAVPISATYRILTWIVINLFYKKAKHNTPDYKDYKFLSQHVTPRILCKQAHSVFTFSLSKLPLSSPIIPNYDTSTLQFDALGLLLCICGTAMATRTTFEGISCQSPRNGLWKIELLEPPEDPALVVTGDLLLGYNFKNAYNGRGPLVDN